MRYRVTVTLPNGALFRHFVDSEDSVTDCVHSAHEHGMGIEVYDTVTGLYLQKITAYPVSTEGAN